MMSGVHDAGLSYYTWELKHPKKPCTNSSQIRVFTQRGTYRHEVSVGENLSQNKTLASSCGTVWYSTDWLTHCLHFGVKLTLYLYVDAKRTTSKDLEMFNLIYEVNFRSFFFKYSAQQREQTQCWQQLNLSYT